VLFDQYAPRFEAALVDDLGYRGPALLFRAVLSVRAAARKPAFFRCAIDLGCGTGLAAAAFAREVDRFVGIDLSPRMIERARATGLYAELEVAEMAEGLRRRPGASADLILAADAMVYVADLVPVLREAKRVLAPGGVVAFTVETHGGDGVILGDGLRYAHGTACVRASIEAAGLNLSQCEDLSARNEDNVPVPGLVVVATKPTPSFRGDAKASPRNDGAEANGGRGPRASGCPEGRARRNGCDCLPVMPCRRLAFCPHLRPRPTRCCRTGFVNGSRAAAGRRANTNWRCWKRPATAARRC
jgi:predicted TPR repeat methyltransferase